MGAGVQQTLLQEGGVFGYPPGIAKNPNGKLWLSYEGAAPMSFVMEQDGE